MAMSTCRGLWTRPRSREEVVETPWWARNREEGERYCTVRRRVHKTYVREEREYNLGDMVCVWKDNRTSEEVQNKNVDIAKKRSNSL